MSITRRSFCQSAVLAPTIAFLGNKLHLSKSHSHPPADVPGVNYMLRYFIRTETVKEQTEDLMAYCRRN